MNSSGGSTVVIGGENISFAEWNTNNYLHIDFSIDPGSDYESYEAENPSTAWYLWCGTGTGGIGQDFNLLDLKADYMLDGIDYFSKQPHTWPDDVANCAFSIGFRIGGYDQVNRRYYWTVENQFIPIRVDYFHLPETKIVFHPVVIDEDQIASESVWLENIVNQYDVGWQLGRTMPLDVTAWEVGGPVVADTTGIERAQDGFPRYDPFRTATFDALLNQYAGASFGEGITFHVAVVSPEVINGHGQGAGSAAVGSPYSVIFWSYNKTILDDVLQHEIGHNLGLLHTYCSGMEGDPTLDVDYPNPDGFIEQDGYAVNPDRKTFQVIPGESTYDFMSFCNPAWPSARNYEKMIAFLRELEPNVSARVVVADPEIVECQFGIQH
ncbi:MAG: hypothetical protein F4X08_12130 [Gemmatimonadetes bacterium]|nr:hypothetical protein [Gemmatimonadota bacterium]